MELILTFVNRKIKESQNDYDLLFLPKTKAARRQLCNQLIISFYYL